MAAHASCRLCCRAMKAANVPPTLDTPLTAEPQVAVWPTPSDELATPGECAMTSRSTRDPSTLDLPARRTWYAIPGDQILGQSGHGGMGVVYKAKQLKANRVAVRHLALFRPPNAKRPPVERNPCQVASCP